MSVKTIFTVTSPVRVGGKDYAIGDSIELDQATADAHPTRFGKPGNESASATGGKNADTAGDDYVARVKDDLVECQRLRDETQALADQAAKDKADAQVMFDEATAKLDDALKASTDAQEAANQAAKDKAEAEATLAQVKSECEAAEKALAGAKKAAKKN